MTTKEKFEELKELELNAKTNKELNRLHLEFEKLADYPYDFVLPMKKRTN